METRFNLCPDCDRCPEVVITGERVRISDDKNLLRGIRTSRAQAWSVRPAVSQVEDMIPTAEKKPCQANVNGPNWAMSDRRPYCPHRALETSAADRGGGHLIGGARVAGRPSARSTAIRLVRTTGPTYVPDPSARGAQDGRERQDEKPNGETVTLVVGPPDDRRRQSPQAERH